MDDLIEMLLWINTYAADRDIPAIVWAGDIFNHKQPGRTSHALVLRMIEVVQDAKRLGIELLIVVGNHDISNDVLESVTEKQPLGVLLASGARELNGWHETLPIFGVPWQQRWLHEDTPMEAFDRWRSAGGVDEGGDYAQVDLTHALTVTHAPIYPPVDAAKQLFELVPTTGPHGLGEAMGHMGFLYYGHIHEDHGIWEDDGVTYANMGALSRGSLHEYNVERSIKVAVWADGEDGTELGFREVAVPHKPASEVFKLEAAQISKSEKLSLDRFLNDVGSSTLDISSTGAVIEHIKTMDVTERVKKTAITILEEVEK
jgi:hypothetical protein